MTERRFYCGSLGPFFYEDTDTYPTPDAAADQGFGDGATMEAIRTDGSAVFGSIKISDTDSSHELELKWNENDSADRIFNFLVGGGDRSFTLNENFTIGDGNAGTITFTGASKTLSIEDTSVVSQDYSSDSTTVSLAGLALTGNLTLAANSITGTSVDINNAEMQQLSNIGAATISSTQWSYLGSSTAAGGAVLDAANDAAILALLSGDATAAFDWGGQNLTNLGTLTAGASTLTIDATVSLSALAAASHAMSTHSDEDTYNIATSGSILSSGTGGVTSGSISNTGKLVIYDGSDHKITITSPSIAGDWQMTLPPNDGDAGNILTTDGDGICTWTGIGAGDVTAAAALTDHLIVRGDAAAKAVQTSGVTLDDSNNLSGVGTIGCGTVTSSGNVVIADAGNIGSATDTDAIAISAAGEIVMNAQPSFMAKCALMANFADGTTLAFGGASEPFDQNSDFNTGTYTFTAPVTGKYLFTVRGRIDSAVTNKEYALRIVTSNRSYHQQNYTSSAWETQNCGFSVIADMDASDTAYVTIHTSDAGETADFPAENEFTGCLLA